MTDKNRFTVYILDDINLYTLPLLPIKIGTIFYNDANYETAQKTFIVFDKLEEAEAYSKFLEETYLKKIAQISVEYKQACKQVFNDIKKNRVKDVRKLKLKRIEKF